YPFGYKVSWFAVRASDSAAVVDALEFGVATPANWRSGLSAAGRRDDPSVFVSPPVAGWVLVVGFSLPYPVAATQSLPVADTQALREIGRKLDVLLARLAKRFDEVQFFGSYRVVDFVAWARAQNGKPTRVFSFADGEVFANAGEQTSEEASLNFANLT